MSEQNSINFNRIVEAIDYLRRNFKEQPNLIKVAEKVHLSPYHFQRLFTEWAGVSPKKFLQFISIEYAKKILKENNTSLLETSIETGLSGTGRLHDLFISIEGMTPGEYKNGGENLVINYSFSESIFGNFMVASTSKDICFLAFADDETNAFQSMQHSFPKAIYNQMMVSTHQNAVMFFTQDWSKLTHIKLHLKSTEFQLKVWEALLKIPMGHLSTYGKIAANINKPKATRAVGSAIGSNPVAFLIPCHRVIQSSDIIGQYHWGNTRKTAIIGWEASQIK
jgi:AraC family transcriptional regulator of adaptative response/methylated-DNA-[protein]-cysteine methyltransferase